MKSDHLRRIPLFRSLGAEDLDSIFKSLEEVQVPPETVLIREGEPGDSLFVILSGEVEVIKAMGTPDERFLRRNGEGDFIGELSLINPDGLRQASVRTLRETRLAKLSHSEFRNLLDRRPTVAMEIMRELSQRLRESERATIRDLQRVNSELVLAYDKTLEGWARALELRDHETEGHTRRVTNLTVRLASQLGFMEEDLVQVRRGAMLHDIGKIAIPDAILMKPSKLTDDEWKVMRKHPILALEMLAPIDFLMPAIEIPYYHHERWDGTGYPHGLKQEQIPLAARIFAVIDVWDALISDRPYRKAISEEEALSYIRNMSGIQFDPTIVLAFLGLIDQDRTNNFGLWPRLAS